MDRKKYNKIYSKKRPKLRISELNIQKKKDEQAATLESTDKPPGTFRRISNYSSAWKNRRGNNLLKPVMLAVISALVIGSLFGFIMLRMFVTMDTSPDLSGNTNPSVVGTDDVETENETGTEQDVQVLEFAPVTAYVLQAGIFTEKENADAWAANFEAANIPAMIWNRDGQYFLFAGVAHSPEASAQAAKELETEELELYSKEWHTPDMALTLTENEADWLDSYLEWWNQALASDGEETAGQIDQLMASFPDETDKLEPLYEKMVDIENDVNDKKLLELWHIYETLDE